MLISLSSFLFQLLQGRQCLFKIRSSLHWHSIGTCLVRPKPPITIVMVIFLWGQMVGMIFIRKNIHLSTSIFVSTIFQSYDCGMFLSRENLSWMHWKNFFLHFFFSWLAVQYIPCLPASYHIDVREVVLS